MRTVSRPSREPQDATGDVQAAALCYYASSRCGAQGDHFGHSEHHGIREEQKGAVAAAGFGVQSGHERRQVRKHHGLTDHSGNGQQQRRGGPMLGSDAPPAQDEHTENSGDDGRQSESAPVAAAGGLEDGRTAKSVVDGPNDPNQQTEPKEKGYLFPCHESTSKVRMYQAVRPRCTTWYSRMQSPRETRQREIVERCLGALVEAGSIDLSLDQLADAAGISKRMLVHYFGDRRSLEEQATTLLEERLRAQFAPEAFPASVSAREVVMTLWERTTAARARGVLLLVMDLSRRAW